MGALRPLDGVEHDAADARAEVERVVEPPRRPRAQRGDRLRGRELAAGRVGRDGRGLAGQAAAEQVVDRAGVQGALRRPTRSDGSGLTSTRSPVATASSGRAGQLAGDEQVVVAGDGVPGGAQPRRAERALGAGEEAGMAGRVDVGAVVRRVRVARALDAVVAGRAAVGVHETAVERALRPGHLVRLGVVDEVAVDDDRVGPGGVERADGGRQDLEGERLLGAEDGGERRPEAVEEHRPRRGLLVAHVDVGEDPERAEHAARGRGGREVGPVAQRLAGPALERAVAVRVDERRAQGRAVRGRPLPAPRRRSRTPRRACPRRRRTSSAAPRCASASFLAQPRDGWLGDARGAPSTPPRRPPGRRGRRRRAPPARPAAAR